MTLESRITHGSVTYITAAWSGSEVVLIVLDPDDLDATLRTVTVRDVHDFSIEASEPFDPTTVEGIIGVDEYPEEDGFVRYVVATDQREFHFRSSAEVAVVNATTQTDRPRSQL